jgi:hypothetical protein
MGLHDLLQGQLYLLHVADHMHSNQRPSKCRNPNPVVTVEFYARTICLPLIPSLNRLQIFWRFYIYIYIYLNYGHDLISFRLFSQIYSSGAGESLRNLWIFKIIFASFSGMYQKLNFL